MEQKHKLQIEKIMSEMTCLKDFQCCKTGFENLSKIKHSGPVLECLQDNPQSCKFALPFGYTYFCRCPLLNYVAGNLTKLPLPRQTGPDSRPAEKGRIPAGHTKDTTDF